jgi:hypothetical protein
VDGHPVDGRLVSAEGPGCLFVDGSYESLFSPPKETFVFVVKVKGNPMCASVSSSVEAVNPDGLGCGYMVRFVNPNLTEVISLMKPERFFDALKVRMMELSGHP